jgi:hypothetical protein
MQAEERELAVARMRRVAEEVGVEQGGGALGREKRERWVGLMESTVDGVRRAAAELGLDGEGPAFAPVIGGEDA